MRKVDLPFHRLHSFPAPLDDILVFTAADLPNKHFWASGAGRAIGPLSAGLLQARQRHTRVRACLSSANREGIGRRATERNLLCVIGRIAAPQSFFSLRSAAEFRSRIFGRATLVQACLERQAVVAIGFTNPGQMRRSHRFRNRFQDRRLLIPASPRPRQQARMGRLPRSEIVSGNGVAALSQRACVRIHR